MVLEMNVLNGIFNGRNMFQPKYHWIEIKYLGAMQNQRRQLFSRCDYVFSQYTLAFATAIVACRRELERMYIYSIIHSNIFVNIRNIQILILSCKISSLASHLYKVKIEVLNVSP